MEWENKIKMVQLGNKARNSEDKVEFQNFVLEHVETFDEQAFDMLFNLIELIPDEMRQDVKFYTKLYPKTKGLDYDKFGMRAGMRLALLNTICEEKLNLK